MSEETRYQIDALKTLGSSLEVYWQDGHVSRYPGIWLLEACLCESCGDSKTAVRHVRPNDRPARPQIESCHHNESQLHIDWGNAHRSSYDLSWLRSKCLSDEERKRRKFKPRLWGREMLDRLPYLNYSEVSASPSLQLQFLESILEHGFVVLRAVPAESERTEEIAALIGKLRLTNYEIYELKSKPEPEIAGDMALPLTLHTDEPYRIEPPGITFFHVLKQSQNGGASTLIDSFNLVEMLKRQDPAAFDILCNTSAHFHRSLIEGRRFEYQHPIVQLDGDGEITSVRLLDRGMAPVDCALEQVEPFYDALRTFLDLSDNGEGKIEFKLESGEMLVFNNQRLMHGRTAFDPSEGRHVRTCHVDLDEFYSRLRIMYHDANNPRQWMTFRKD